MTTTFAHQLSERFLQNPDFTAALANLQSAGAVSTLAASLERLERAPDFEELTRLLYCASVFAQADNEPYLALAQNIAFNALLVSKEPGILERSAYILAEIGNFPGTQYLRERFGPLKSSLMGFVHDKVGQELNTVDVGGQMIALTDYQKRVWDRLEQGDDLAISAPTSAGKSFLVIENLARRMEQATRCVCVYIAPTRALLAEVLAKIKKRLELLPDIRISEIPTVEAAEKQVFVLTQERFQMLLAATAEGFDMIIVDEAQNLSDGARGIILQEAIEQAIQRRAQTHVVMLAPGADGFKEAVESFGLSGVDEITTALSPVLQNRISVSSVPDERRLDFRLLGPDDGQLIGSISPAKVLTNNAARLASVALNFGAEGGSLLYAKSPSEAASLANTLQRGLKAKHGARQLNSELAEFIRDHIHPEYSLITLVEQGVAFHYGQMPALLRDAIEVAFKQQRLKFLVCTTTLFQGINLPARNVFISTPKRGRHEKTTLKPALLWNFAGRAGRMTEDIVGNVFLIDYEQWDERLMDEPVPFKIEPSLGKTITEHASSVLEVLHKNPPPGPPREELHQQVQSAAGLLITKARQGHLSDWVSRVAPGLEGMDSYSLRNAAQQAAESLAIPTPIMTANWSLDLFALNELLEYFQQQIAKGSISKYIPANPTELGDKAFSSYRDIFNLMFKLLKGFDGNFGGYVSPIAVRWMEGTPYPVILKQAIVFEQQRLAKRLSDEEALRKTGAKIRRSRKDKVDKNAVINKTFETIENIVRFQLVQMGKAYVDLLAHALRNAGESEKVSHIFDFAMALELGISSATGRALMELGLSRIAASEMQRILDDQNLSITQVRGALENLPLQELNLNPFIVEELRALGVHLEPGLDVSGGQEAPLIL
ncbi:DEAD/DEAH box helicase [Pseudomonas sp. NY15181]|uniref:DEAD/DEAH box helicase n=1 Tax=Pseudomonas sp. NY15181 TaxID=3400349 RepID=UPI003A83DCB4